MYDYLKQWLSAKEIKRLREGDNEHGIVLTRQQVYNIMTGKSKNPPFLNILIAKAKENEQIQSSIS